jgi:ATP-dependent protease ClpP protease subunit
MADYKKLIDMTKDYVLERTSIPKALYTKNKSKDWYMYLDDQLKYGVIDAVIDNLSVIV